MSLYLQLTNELRDRQKGMVPYSPLTQIQLTALSYHIGASVEDLMPTLIGLIQKDNYGIPALVQWPSDQLNPTSSTYEAITLDRYQSIALAALVNISTFPKTVAYWDNIEDTKRQLQLQNVVLPIARPVQPQLPANNPFKLVRNQLTMSTVMMADLLGVSHYDVVTSTERMFNDLGFNPADYLSQEVQPHNVGRTYDLPKLEGFTVLSGYNIRLRYTITARWLALENPVITQMAPYDLYLEMHKQFGLMQQELSRTRIENQRQQMALQDLKQDNELLARNILVLKGEEVDPLSYDEESLWEQELYSPGDEQPVGFDL
jgi:hypothetical protein